MTLKPQRIRDPVHNLIEFGTDDLERRLWQVIQTRPFQRLRHIKQLGFSELVFPGATHTRFAHSLGVFHIARQLMDVIRRHLGTDTETHRIRVALAAALLHDVGHGMFSHAFETVGKEFNLPMAQHEHVSAAIIRSTEIAGLLKPLADSFADEVATLVGQKGPGNLYDAVVSSQFDADRLDYMQRDRMMTGVRSSGVDQTWLIANLEVRAVPTGADDSQSESIDTLILGPKAIQTAESYLLSLFHLYPNVYLHKATRGTEQLFAALMRRLLRLERAGHAPKSGLAVNHPIRRFISAPDELERALALDDTVFWGALPMMINGKDAEIRKLASALSGRKLLRCIDLTQRVAEKIPLNTRASTEEDRAKAAKEHRAKVAKAVDQTMQRLQQRATGQGGGPSSVMVDRFDRSPYKRYQESDTPLNRMLIRDASGKLGDIAEQSVVIGAAQPFRVNRVYIFRDDKDAAGMVENEIGTSVQGTQP